MLLNSCANPPVEAERHFKSAEMFNQVTRNSKEVLVTLSAITHSTKVMAETMFLAFLLHLIPLSPTPAIQALRDTSSLPPGPGVFSYENKADGEGGSTLDGGHCGLSGHASKEQAGRFCHHCFLLKHFCSSTVSLQKGGEHRVIFKRGFSA